MYKIEKLDDKQLENITGGMEVVGALGSCLGGFSCCISYYYFYNRDNKKATRNRIRQHINNNVTEYMGIPVSNIEYSDDDTSTVD